MRLDTDAGSTTHELRQAQRELEELAKKTKASEEIIAKSRADMAFLESEVRRQYKRVDELEERKTERAGKLFAARNDDEHRTYKREIDNIDRDLREFTKRIEESESKMEQLKSLLTRTEGELNVSIQASSTEREKAKAAEEKSAGKLSELNAVRQQHLARLDDRLAQHYQRVAKLTRNPNGPITRIPDGACGNCHMRLAPQLLNTLVRGKDVEFCPSCNHILLPSHGPA